MEMGGEQVCEIEKTKKKKKWKNKRIKASTTDSTK